MSEERKIGVIGAGEIGQALIKLIGESTWDLEERVVDPALGRNDDLGECSIIHVAVPAGQVFKAIEQNLQGNEDAIWVINSTVRPGTCRRLTKNFEIEIFHSPVRGIHPDLDSGFLAFQMFLGGRTQEPGESAIQVVQHYDQIDVAASYMGVWENTELAKVMSTTRYGWEILFVKELHRLCERFGADFEFVNDIWTGDYNHGYEVLGQEHFARSILSFMPGPIGGHCILPNAEMMAEDSIVAEIVNRVGSEEHWDMVSLDERWPEE